MQGVFITGTDTGVGKTWFAEQMLPKLKAAGLSIHVRKPVESGWLEDWQSTDAGRLLLAAQIGTDLENNLSQQLASICPYRFKAALSPVRAAAYEGQQLTIADLNAICQSNDEQSFTWVEGAGGFYSPLTHDGLNADLAQTLALPVILVAEDRLGSINQVLLGLEAIQRRGLTALAVLLNPIAVSSEGLMDNAADLRRLTDVPICQTVEACLPLLINHWVH